MPLEIIFLDDEPLLCELFVDNFSSSNVSVQAFTDPQQAIKSINDLVPDLVFLDYRLYETTGEDVALRLKSTIPKVLVSGELSVKASKSFVKVFHKPFDFAEMEAFIHSYLERKKTP